jgi:mevalonate kinase
MLFPLTSSSVQSFSCGKTILLGEHAVVYGYPALALGLPNIRLSITLHAPTRETLLSWEKAWHTSVICGQPQIPSLEVQGLLYQALKKAFEYCDVCLSDYAPQYLSVHSQIPLKGGMGGSAALSVALLGLACQVTGKSFLPYLFLEYANAIDCLFHAGRASGLDVTAVNSQGIIYFKKQASVEYVTNSEGFWLAIVDSQERADTATMVQKVGQKLQTHPIQTQQTFERLGDLTHKARMFLETGKVELFAQTLNQAQGHLEDLGVSTENLQKHIDMLKSCGALGAKLTGAGGGGLVLGVFLEEPHPQTSKLFSLFSKNNVYLSYVHVTKAGKVAKVTETRKTAKI